MLQYIDIMGYTISLYKFWNGISTAVMFIYLVFQTDKFSDISPYAVKQPSEGRKMLVGVGQVLAIIVFAFVLFKLLNASFAEWFTSGNANYYGSLTAWFIGITTLTIVFKTSPFLVHDMFAPALPIQLFIAKISCFCYGCCSGFEMPGSWYFNQKNGRDEFPVQLIEALVALALFVILRWYQKRNRIAGSIFPVYLVLYAASRFATEFLRADYPNVYGPFDAYQIMSVVYVFLGGILLHVVWRCHHASSKGTENLEVTN